MTDPAAARVARQARRWALVGLGLGALVVVALAVTAGCGDDAKAKAQAYYFEARSIARSIERDPDERVRLLRGVAYHFEDPERAAAYERLTGVRPVEPGRASELAAESRARADAIEADPQLYAQTERCAADIVAERFRLEGRARMGPQLECGHCVGAPMCEPWRPVARAARS